jgi:hypothetical protein
MDLMGLDLHKRESKLSIRAEDGTIAERRIVTSRERFTAVLGREHPRALVPPGAPSPVRRSAVRLPR